MGGKGIRGLQHTMVPMEGTEVCGFWGFSILPQSTLGAV
jgi:hypothetical protein